MVSIQKSILKIFLIVVPVLGCTILLIIIGISNLLLSSIILSAVLIISAIGLSIPSLRERNRLKKNIKSTHDPSMVHTMLKKYDIQLNVIYSFCIVESLLIFLSFGLEIGYFEAIGVLLACFLPFSIKKIMHTPDERKFINEILNPSNLNSDN